MNNFNNIQNIITQMQSFRQNPGQFLIQNGLNIPQEYMKDPNTAIQYLMNNGKVSQNQYNNALQMARNMGFKYLSQTVCMPSSTETSRCVLR